MTKVYIKENSWIAAVAARKLRCNRLAIVLGRTIYLHNVSTADFVSHRRWVVHELKHVDQFQQYGTLRFLWLYLQEHLKNGYHKNRFEIEACRAEGDENLLLKYDMTDYIKHPG
jgi:hypothetical protein